MLPIAYKAKETQRQSTARKLTFVMAAFNSQIAAVAVVCLLGIMQANAYTMQNMCEQWSGRGYIGNPTDCTGWGFCENQKLVSWGNCGKGLVYQPSTGTCEYNTKCVCSTSVAQTCTNIQSPGFVADPTDCTKYAYCNGAGKSQVMQCPSGQVYAANNVTCVWGPSCPQNSICRFMQNNIYVGDPDNCGNYLQCMNGYGLRSKCPTVPGKLYYFDAATGNCQTTNPCSNSGGNNSPTTDLVPGTTVAEVCSENVNTYVTDGSTCYGYYKCSGGTSGVWGACPTGYEFSASAQRCVSPASIACKWNRCANTNLQYATVPNSDCKQYTYCPNGSVGQCPSNFPYYDEVNKKCVPTMPDYAICKQTAT